MKTLFRIGLLLALGLQGRVAWSQSNQEPENISTGQLLEQRLGAELAIAAEGASSSNQASLVQHGTLNQGRIDQNMLGVGRGNTALITQNGNGNLAAILQNGNGSRTTISQVGTNNMAASEINGYNTESDILQKGSGNRVDQRLSVDERRYTVEQMGHNNNLVQRESGSTAPGYEVTMKGNGIRLIIEQGRVATLP